MAAITATIILDIMAIMGMAITGIMATGMATTGTDIPRTMAMATAMAMAMEAVTHCTTTTPARNDLKIGIDSREC
jgi:esterase/lipase